MPYANDDFANAILLTGASGSIIPFHYDGVSDPATSETGEDLYGAGETLWWKWVAPADGTITFDTLGSPSDDADPTGLDTKIQVFVIDFSTANIVATNDDHGGTDPYDFNSLATLPVTAGETYYLQVDMFSTAEVGTLHLHWSFAEAPPDPPTITSATFSGTRVLAGETTFDVIGTGFDTLTQVTFGDLNVPVPYTVIDSTHMTVGPLPARIGSNGHITALNAGGSGVSAATWFVYYPGPWTTPPVTDGTEEGFAARVFRTATPFPEGTTEPDFTGDPVYATSTKFNSLNAETVDLDTGMAKWNQGTTLLLIDATPTPFNMPALSYDPGDGTVADQENASDTGSIVETVDPTIDISTRLSESYYVDSVNDKSTSRADYDIWMQQLEYRRWSDSSSLPSALPAGLASLPLFAVRDLFETAIDINLINNGGTNNYAWVNGESDAPAYDLVGDHYVVPWADWDAGHKISWVVCYSSLTTGPAIDAPVVTPEWFLGNAISDKNINHWIAARVRFTYQPPDYRLIYFDPPPITGQLSVYADGQIRRIGCGALPVAENILTNPGAEDGTATGYSSVSALTLSATTDEARSGTYSFKTETTGYAYEYTWKADQGGTFGSVPCTAGVPIAVGGYVKFGSGMATYISEGQAYIRLDYYTASNVFISEASVVQVPVHDFNWTLVSRTDTPPAGAAKVVVAFVWSYSGSPTDYGTIPPGTVVYWDDMFFGPSLPGRFRLYADGQIWQEACDGDTGVPVEVELAPGVIAKVCMVPV